MMNTKKTFFILTLILVSLGSFSQKSLPVTENFQTAVKNNTRTLNGEPGADYWQNHVIYDIKAEIIPSEKKLTGSQTITYVNHSPDTLDNLVLKVFQNLYKKGSAKDFPIAPEDIHPGVTITDFRIRNKIFTDYNVSGTNLIAELTNPLLPGKTISIELKWSFPIPANSNIRMGAKNDSSFFLGQWYPKMAVYDDLKGWDMQQHTGHPEFYSDLGDYSYTIHVPEGYMAWGTGTLTNAKKVLSDETYSRYRTAQESDTIVQIVNNHALQNGKLTKDSVWKFKALNTPDVAFGISNHHLWDAVSLKGISEESVFVEAAYPQSAEDFTEVAALAKKTLQSFSTDLPGYPYPFPSVTVFNGTNGTSGMEYPMIANNPSADNRGRTVDVTAHEIAHNYIPFYVLTNETEHAWMDEAFASMITCKHQQQTEPSLNRMTRYAKRVSRYANTDKNIPTMTNSTMLQGRSYYFNFYTQPALSLYFLKNMLGEELFQKCLYSFIKTWKGKHPAPYDFFYSLNQTSGKNLNWYWKRWFFESNHPDLKIEKVTENDDTWDITIQKIGELPVPVHLKIIYTNNTTKKIDRTAAVWENNDKLIITVENQQEIDKITLGNSYIPDTNPVNNVYQQNK